jgi:hypothetical protein
MMTIPAEGLRRLIDDFRTFEAAVVQQLATMKTTVAELRATDRTLAALGEPSRNRVMRLLRDDDPKSVLAASRDIVARIERVILANTAAASAS